MEASFELFDHTADIGIRARAATLPELATVMGGGLYAVIGELLPAQGAVAEPRELKIELQHADIAVLLRDYLDELLVLFDRDHRIVTVANVSTFGEGRLVAVLETTLVDHQRSVYQHEVKAITYHELDIRQIPGGFEAAVIVDI
ncbi:MAG: archease [Planctomycetota bacterium]|nr:archease [Planctomycetota bacterium]